MPESNGKPDHDARHADIEEAIHALLEHAATTDQRIEALRGAVQTTNENVQGLNASVDAMNGGVRDLVGAIRDLIDRIPPENLR